MGPSVLFDKSFLQSLSLDESVWFDNFFMAVVCPYFFVETLADLEKPLQGGHRPEEVVKRIASKFPDMGGAPCAYHGKLATSELLGAPIPMTGQIPLAAPSRNVRTDDRRGVVFERSGEADAFTRWQKGEFRDVERRFAAAWRASLTNQDAEQLAESMRRLGITGKTCKGLQDAWIIARDSVASEPSPDRVRAIVTLLGGPQVLEAWALSRLEEAGNPPLTVFAPYAAHLLTADIFFRAALAAQLISSSNSSRIDIAYLFYLPFCHVFVSSDRLHERCAPLFLRDNQQFLWGPDLKADLARLNDHYLELPMNEREKGVMKFASSPPRDGDFLVGRIWDVHWPHWRERPVKRDPMDEVKGKELVEHLGKFMKAPGVALDKLDDLDSDPQSMGIKRLVRKRKGSWFQIPKHIEPKKGN